ncbi:MAG: ketoacyl-ACP synthase III [Lachnospiraceae bacterium]|nr:ketoacyl-ACP synthase III [Lachnospiraceae bacterium]
MFGKIIGTGAYVPKRRVSNQELTNIIDSSDEWISERTGIRARHVMENETTAQMAYEASKSAIQNAGSEIPFFSAKDIDLIIVSSVSSNLILPNTACYVQERLGAVNAMCFDINTACTGFMVAYNTAQSYINSGWIETALIVAAEGLSKLVDWTDRETCILFGDGAGAAVIRKDEKAVFDTVMHADGTGGRALFMENDFAKREIPFESENIENGIEEEKDINGGNKELVPSDSNYISMDGREVFRFAIDRVPKCIKELLQKMDKQVDDIDLFVLHQANERIVSSIAKRVGVDMKKVPINMAEYGNTSSACIPILLNELVEKGKIKRGDRIIMSGFGAGLTWAATYMEF